METKLNKYLYDLCNDAKVCIWGFGKEGQSTYRILRNLFPDKLLYICDDVEVSLENCIQVPTIELNTCDVVFKSPGIPVLDDSIRTDILTSQTDIFLQLFGHQTIAITGTKGKSTTCSLLTHVLQCNGYDVQLVGNIGKPCFDAIDLISSTTIVVYEISAHQLQFVHNSARVAVLLNLHQEHLDHYIDYQQYCDAKANVYRYQKSDDLAIINKEALTIVEGVSHAVSASVHDETADIYVRNDGFIHTPFGNIYISETPLLGIHNLYNTAIVYAIVRKTCNMADSNFLAALKSFTPLPHRLQCLGTFNGITYYDDSISTIGAATIAALESLKQANTVIIGGMDRGIDYTDLIEYLQDKAIKSIYCMYASGKRIADALHGCKATVYYFDDLYSVIDHIKTHATIGDTVVLSPAAPSYGYFKNFEHRGEVFSALVRQ